MKSTPIRRFLRRWRTSRGLGKVIYEDPKQFESLRAAIARAIPEHKAIREFSISMDIEPLLNFKR